MMMKIWWLGLMIGGLVVAGMVSYVMWGGNRSEPKDEGAAVAEVSESQEGEIGVVDGVGMLVENDPATAKVGYSLVRDEGVIYLDLSRFKRELVDSYVNKKVAVGGDQWRIRLWNPKTKTQDTELTDYVHVIEMKLAE